MGMFASMIDVQILCPVQHRPGLVLCRMYCRLLQDFILCPVISVTALFRASLYSLHHPCSVIADIQSKTLIVSCPVVQAMILYRAILSEHCSEDSVPKYLN